MNREFLKGLGLPDEQVEQIMTEHGKSLQSANAEKTSAIAERDSYKQQLESQEEQLKNFKKENKDNADFKAKLDELQTKYDESSQASAVKLAEVQKNNAIELALRDSGAKNSKAVSALLDMDTISFKDGKLAGFDEQIKSVQKDNDYLFKGADDKPKDVPNITIGGNSNPTNNNEPSMVQKIQNRLGGN